MWAVTCRKRSRPSYRPDGGGDATDLYHGVLALGANGRHNTNFQTCRDYRRWRYRVGLPTHQYCLDGKGMHTTNFQTYGDHRWRYRVGLPTRQGVPVDGRKALEKRYVEESSMGCPTRIRYDAGRISERMAR